MNTGPADQSYAAVVALKPNAAAKSRLSTLPSTLRRTLAWAMAVDTLRALASSCGEVVVVGDRDDLAAPLRSAGLSVTLVDEEGSGLNAALRLGAAHLVAEGWPTVISCVGDLPALRPASVADVASLVPRGTRGFVPDRSGIGTTLVIANGVDLDPRYQGQSAAAHETSGAARLPASADARCDVDTVADLAAADQLGLGSATAAVLAAEPGLRRQLH